MNRKKTWTLIKNSLSLGKIGFLLLIHTIFSGYSQVTNTSFYYKTSADGLSQDNVICIFKDQYGFIWIGTEDGLNLYDGYTYKTYRPEPDDSTSIANNIIKTIEEDSKGNIWIGTNDGLSRYDREMDRFVNYFKDEEDNTSIANNTITDILNDSKGRLWIGTIDGLSLYQPGSDDFTTYRSEQEVKVSLLNNMVRSITEDYAGNIWLGVLGGVSKFDSSGRFSNIYFDPDDEQGLPSPEVSSICFDERGKLWIGTFDQGVALYDVNTKTFRYFKENSNNSRSLTDNYITAIKMDPFGKIWVGTEVGLNEYNGKGRFITHVSDSEAGSLNSDIILDIFFEQTGRMWVATRLGGINVFDPDKNRFVLFESSLQNKNALSSNKTSGFLEDKNGNFFVAMDGTGIDYFDLDEQSFSAFLRSDPSNPNSLSNDKVLAMEMDRRGDLWIGFWGGGLDHYDRRTGSIKHYRHDPNDPRSLSGDEVFTVFEDSRGILWVGTWNKGLNRYHKETDDFTHYTYDPSNSNSMGEGSISKIVEDGDGNIWVATISGGITVLNPEGRIIKKYTRENDLISHNTVISLLMGSGGQVYAGSVDGGLHMLDSASDKFKSYNMDDGLPNNSVVGILEAENGSIWVSTNAGISHFDPESHTFKNYDVRDGLQGNQFMPRNSLKLSTGHLLFGGNNGFNMFDPNDLVPNQIPPRVYISELKLFNQVVSIEKGGILESNVMFADQIELRHDQNFISFQFLGIEHRDQFNVHYQYQMEGLQEQWINTGTERRVSFAGLNPGTYVLKVKAANNDGVWNEEPATLKIHVASPFWATWWFRGLIVGLLALLFYLWIKVRTRNTKAFQATLEQKVQEATARVSIQNKELLLQSENLKSVIADINGAVKEAIETGSFGTRVDTHGKEGEWKILGDSVNQLFESLVIPISEINTIIRSVAEGDLRRRYEKEARGDMLQLTTNLNGALDNLSVLLRSMKGKISTIDDAAMVMKDTSNEMDLSAGEIASSIGMVSQGAQNQVVKVDETSSHVESILLVSEKMGEQAEEINRAALAGNEKSHQGMEIIQQLDNGMRDMLTSAEDTNQAILALTDQSKAVSGIINIIKEISAQTNLLALNAAIEAAQAGEAGRGFSVVATEIRKLAEDSKRSVLDIEELILGMQGYAKSTEERMERMNNDIRKSEEATELTLKLFREIADHYTLTLEKSKDILNSTGSQTEKASSIVDLIHSVVAVSEETAAGSTEIASSAAELSAGMTGFSEKTESVSDIVNELRSQINKFQVKEMGADGNALKEGENQDLLESIEKGFRGANGDTYLDR